MKRRVLRSGEVLCRKGEAADSLYLVLTGILETGIPAEAPGVSRLLTGDFADLPALFHEDAREYTLTSSGTTEVLELKQPLFKRVLDDYPTIAAKLRHEA